ncbi:MAG: hypothetical protein QF805_23595, partial [Pirellulaceae bacterium]|nr:hypothetical protein [Pirellulaceae bacterium]
MWRLTIGLICWCSACLVSNGAEPEPVADGEAQAITEILKTGWQTSLAAKRKTDAYYRSLVVAGNVTPDIRRAYLLSLIRTRRYPQALRLTESLLDAKPGDGEILRMKVWLSVITKSYDEAMVDADRLADLAGEMTTDAKDQVAWTLFLGRMIGFVEGPASESAPLGLTDRRRRRLERTLAIDLLKQFQTGRKEVLDRHAELVARRDGLVAKSKADADAEREVKLQDLKAERDRLRDRKDDTTKRQSDLEQALQKRLDEAARQLGPLENERARLDAEGAVVHRELGAIAIDIARLESRAAQIRDPVLRERYYFEIRRL